MPETDKTPIPETQGKPPAKSGGFLNGIVSGPVNFLKSLIAAPFNMVGGLFKGIFRKTIGDPMGVLMTSGVIAGLTQFAPTLITWLPIKIGGRKVGEIMQDHAIEGGFPALLKDSLIAGVTINAAKGAIGGGLGGAMNGSGAETGFAGKAGTLIGGLGTLGLLGMFAFSAVESNKIGFAGHDDSTPKTPGTTPPAPEPVTSKASNKLKS